MKPYGETPENMELIRTKAKNKADGVYSFRGVVYRNKSRRVTHIATGGKVYEMFGAFKVQIGECGWGDGDPKKILKAIQ